MRDPRIIASRLLSILDGMPPTSAKLALERVVFDELLGGGRDELPPTEREPCRREEVN